MKNVFLGMLAALVLGLPICVGAAVVNSVGTVGVVNAYTTYGSGDIAFKLSTQATGCADGYWLKASDPGFKSAYAMLLTAKAAGLSVHVYAVDSDLWPGSAGNICRVDSLYI